MSFSVDEIASITGGRVVNAGELGEKARTIRVERPAPLSASRESDLAFFFSREYQHELPQARAGVLITGEPFVAPLRAAGLPLWERTAVIACKDPYFAMALLSEKFAANLSTVGPRERSAKTLVHSSAVVHPSVVLGAGVEIGENCVLEEGARIGAGTRLFPGCFVGARAEIGEDCTFLPQVIVYEWTRVGSRVRIHAGSVLGADGFGYAPKQDGASVTGHQKIWHLGRVVVGDDVEIGALCTVDRGTLGDTVLGNQVKLDNQVHVGHNAQVAEGAVLCGGVRLAGRASVGRFVYMGGMVGVINNVHVGDGATVAAFTLVSKDVPPGGTAVGIPQRTQKEHFRAHAALNRMIARGKRTQKESD